MHFLCIKIYICAVEIMQLV